MRRARIAMLGKPAGTLEEWESGSWVFRYDPDYAGPPVSLTMPVAKGEHRFDVFPPFFEGLLPEGEMLAGLLRLRKIDRRDLFSQLLAVGADTVGAVTATEIGA
jgi:serine/threonine-protein kinase HipA